jgi:hypothetical protein
MESATAWVDRLRQRVQAQVFYPVTLPGRLPGTGHDQTGALASHPAQRRTIAYNGSGTRYARISLEVAA